MLTAVAFDFPVSTEEGSNKSHTAEQVSQRQPEGHKGHSNQREGPSAAAAPVFTQSSRLPALPPEIIGEIVSHVAADELLPGLERPDVAHRPTTLIACALVGNKTWSTLARKALYRRLNVSHASSLFKFTVFRILSSRSIPGYTVSTVPDLESNTYVEEVELSCKDQSRSWNEVLPTLFLFPHLRSLTLSDLRGNDGLLPLLDQQLPSLRKLSMQADCNLLDGEWKWKWNFGRDYDREQARAFFSRLQTIEFMCPMELNTLRERPEFVETAHENLRSITFPFNTPDHISREFFGRCSAALVAVDLSYRPSLGKRSK
ncbi:hypothetical protein HK102_013615 [Quaeritorhiza haematococci]|nr:hypothetical protein HK102_013615 [Quaeritorhiza haematococci]